MADEETNVTPTGEFTDSADGAHEAQPTEEATAPESIRPSLPDVAVPEASTIGDENLPAREPEVHVHEDAVPAQVTGGPAKVVEEVPVHEVYVVTDTVITDTSDPLAVQIPDAGRGDATLPIHALANGTVEAAFAAHAAKSNS